MSIYPEGLGPVPVIVDAIRDRLVPYFVDEVFFSQLIFEPFGRRHLLQFGRRMVALDNAEDIEIGMFLLMLFEEDLEMEEILAQAHPKDRARFDDVIEHAQCARDWVWEGGRDFGGPKRPRHVWEW